MFAFCVFSLSSLFRFEMLKKCRRVLANCDFYFFALYKYTYLLTYLLTMVSASAGEELETASSALTVGPIAKDIRQSTT